MVLYLIYNPILPFLESEQIDLWPPFELVSNQIEFGILLLSKFCHECRNSPMLTVTSHICCANVCYNMVWLHWITKLEQEDLALANLSKSITLLVPTCDFTLSIVSVITETL